MSGAADCSGDAEIAAVQPNRSPEWICCMPECSWSRGGPVRHRLDGQIHVRESIRIAVNELAHPVGARRLHDESRVVMLLQAQHDLRIGKGRGVRLSGFCEAKRAAGVERFLLRYSIDLAAQAHHFDAAPLPPQIDSRRELHHVGNKSAPHARSGLEEIKAPIRSANVLSM